MSEGSSPRGRPFVGRGRELRDLEDAIADAASGRGCVFAVSGEPGAGKSWLGAEVARLATTHGARAIWGRCWESDGAPAYWPWVQVIRSLLRSVDTDEIVARVGAGAGRIAALSADLARRLGVDGLPAGSPDPEADRFLLCDAAMTLLEVVAEEQPLVLLLDDLHWADLPSLVLLEFAARECPTLRVVVVAFLRPVDANQAPGRAEALSRITSVARHIPLGGLSPAEVGELTTAVGLDLPWRAVDQLHEATGGNPFFVDELARQLLARGGIPDLSGMPLPLSVREAVRSRLRGASPEVIGVLRSAAVFGRTFHVTALESMVGQDRAGLTEMLGRGVEVGILDRAASLGVHSFEHAILQESLYADIPAPELPGLHLRVARALEALYGDRADQHLAEIASHYLRSGDEGTAQAFDHSIAAGRFAAAHLEWEEAVRHFDNALHVMPFINLGQRDRLRFLLDLGTALVNAGARDRASTALRDAVGLAYDLGEWADVMVAALALARPWFARTLENERRLADAALQVETLGEGEPSAERAWALALYAFELARLRSDEVGRTAVRALKEARACGDPGAVATALMARLASLSDPADVDERIRVAGETALAADEAGIPQLGFQARNWLAVAHLEAGDGPAFRSAMDAVLSVSRHVISARELAPARALAATLDGRLDEAERIIVEAIVTGGESGGYFDEIAVAQLGQVQGLRGRFDGVQALGRAGVALDPDDVQMQVILAYGLAMDGRLDESRAGYERFAVRDFPLPRDFTWMTSIQLLSELCHLFRDEARAPVLDALLAPFDNRWGVYAPLSAVSHAVSRHRALMAVTMGRLDDALRHLERAQEFAEAIPSRPHIASGNADLANVFALRGEHDRAQVLAERALAAAREMGLDPIVVQAEAVLAGTARPEGPTLTPAAVPATRRREPVGPGTPADAVLRLDGTYWTLAFDGGAEFRLPDSKGLRCVFLLVSNPSQEFHVVDLQARIESTTAPRRASAGGPQDAGLSISLGDGIPLLDRTAKAAYRARIAELRDEIDEADAWGDAARSTRAQDELDAIAAELGRAVGLGGRSRMAASPVERARVNVTRQVKRVIDAIEPHDRALARHLSDSIRRGAFCSYEPDPGRPVAWRP